MKIANNLKSLVLGALILTSTSVFATAVAPAPAPAPAPDPFPRKDLAAALINYEAAALMQNYMLNQQLLFMGAPATIWAIQAGAVVGASDTTTTAMNISDQSLLYSLGGLTKADQVTLHGNKYPVNTTQVTGPIAIYNQMQKFFQSGDATGLATISISSIMQSDNLNTASPAITQTQAQTLVNTLVDPFPAIDPVIKVKIQNGQTLTGQDMETLGGKIASYAIVGVSAMALSDIVARRIPTQGQQKSVMQIMDEMSQKRMNKTDWYNDIGAASEAALLREIAHMMAYNQWVAYQQFRVSEQQVALLASLNAVMAKTNVMIDQLNRQLMAAQAQAQSSSAELQQKLNNMTTGNTTQIQAPQ